MRLAVAAILFLLLLVMLFGDFSGDKGGALNVIGSTSVQPFAEMLAEEFDKTTTEFVVDVQGGGSTAGVQAAANGIADIGMCSRSLKGEEAAIFTPIVIARDGLAVVIHSSNPVTDLSRDQIRRLFTGEVTNWNQVGGPDRPVRLITREEGSGTREAFSKLVMEQHVAAAGKPVIKDGKPLIVPHRISRKALTQESNGAVRELVRDDPAAIGYMSLGLVGTELKMVRVDGQEPTTAAVLAGNYPLVRPFLFITKGAPSPRAQQFIDFVLSAPAQELLAREGLVKVK